MRRAPALLAGGLLAALLGWVAWQWQQAAPPPAPPANDAAKAALVPPAATAAAKLETEHYAITSYATTDQTRRVAAAVESLHRAYVAFFNGMLPAARPAGRLQLVLYRDRPQFVANNRSQPWAEAYYRAPACHAYFAADAANPYHWMLHEATHQLNHELAGFRPAKWVNEGLASYFGTSAIREGELRPGEVDAGTYPIWWLASLGLSGDLGADLEAGLVIPLRVLVSGQGGPDIGQFVNRYYVGYWSLSHFLFHHDGGRHAAAYRQLIREGGTVAGFERLIGPIEQVQVQWYAYLQGQVARQQAGDFDRRRRSR